MGAHVHTQLAGSVCPCIRKKEDEWKIKKKTIAVLPVHLCLWPYSAPITLIYMLRLIAVKDKMYY